MRRQGWVLMAGLAAGLWAAAASAQQTNYAIGQVGGSELKIGLGPRPVGMGEAFVGLADDLNTTAWNPSGLAQIKGYQAGFMHNIYLQDTSLEYLAYAQNLFTGAGIGAYATYLNYGTMDRVDDVGGLPVVNGSFTPTVFSIGVGYGQWLVPAFAVGATVKMLSQSIDTTTYSAVAVDVGALLKPGIEGLQFGLAIQNLGTQLANASLPLNIKVGGAYVVPVKISASDVWNVVVDVNMPTGDTNYTGVNLGTEYWYNQVVAGRVGYQIKNTGDLGGVTGLTAGIGVKVSMLRFDYALVSFGDLGLTHQIAVAVSFD